MACLLFATFEVPLSERVVCVKVYLCPYVDRDFTDIRRKGFVASMIIISREVYNFLLHRLTSTRGVFPSQGRWKNCIRSTTNRFTCFLFPIQITTRPNGVEARRPGIGTPRASDLCQLLEGYHIFFDASLPYFASPPGAVEGRRLATGRHAQLAKFTLAT